MGVVINPYSGQLDITGGGSGGGGSYTPNAPANWNPSPTNIEGALDQLASRTYDANYKTEKFTLLVADITNKQVTLAVSPITPSKTRLVITDGGIEQDYGTDFTVSGNILSWNSLGFESLAEAGDKILVVYSSN